MRAKTAKLARFKCQISCILLGIEYQYIPMRNERDVMVDFEPGPSCFKGWITLSTG